MTQPDLFADFSQQDTDRERVHIHVREWFLAHMPPEYGLGKRWTHTITDDEYANLLGEASTQVGWGWSAAQEAQARIRWRKIALAEGRTEDSIRLQLDY